MCHMTLEVSDFILGSLEYTDNHIEVANLHHFTATKKGQLRIKCTTIMEILSSQRYTNVLLAPYLCNGLFSIIRLMNSEHTCLLHRGFLLYTSEQKRKIQLHYHIVHKGNVNFEGKSRKYQRKRNYHLEIKLL